MAIAVIGGGLTGLSAAWSLTEQGREVILIEPGPLGGLLRTEHIDGCIVECGADSWLASKPWLRNLAVELGRGADVIPCNEAIRQTFILRDGVLHPFPRGMRMVAPTEWTPLLESGLLSSATKLRMLMETGRAPSGAGDRSVAQFVRDHFGDEALEYLAEPIFSGVYGGAPEGLGVASVLPGFLEHERVRGSVIRGALGDPKPTGPLFESMRFGLGQIPDALVERLTGRVRIVRDCAEKVESGRVRVGGEWLAAERVLIATGAPAASALLGDELLGQIRCSSATIFAFGFTMKTPPIGSGFLVPRRERRTIMAGTWVTNKFADRAPAGTVIVRCFVSGDHSEALLPDVLADFARITGIAAEPWFTRVFRWPNSMPQYDVGHADLIVRIEARLPAGVSLAGAYLRGVGMPDCVKSATHAAGRTLATETSRAHSHANPH